MCLHDYHINMTNDQKEFKDFCMEMQVITQEKHLNLLKEIVLEMKGVNFSQDDLLNFIIKIDADIVADLLKLMKFEGLLTDKEFDEIDTKLMLMYQEEFLRDEKNGVFESRLKLKTNKNPRPISVYEMVGIYGRNEPDGNLFAQQISENPLVKRIVPIIMDLKKPEKYNKIYKKFYNTLEQTLTNILNDVKTLKAETVIEK